MKEYKSLIALSKELKLNNIICNDIQAWKKYHTYHNIYNKLWIAESQNLPCGPMGIYPEEYPIIFKPIINLYGMSRGFKIIKNEDEYQEYLDDGLFWMPYLSGDHYTIDLVIIKGEIKHIACLKSFSYTEEGTFNYHESMPEYELPIHIIEWVKLYLKDYIGCANIELINNKIIEVHLRLNGDYYLYDDNFTKELSKLYNEGIWELQYKIEKKYLVPIFIKDNDILMHINLPVLKQLLKNYNCDTLHIDNLDSKYQKEDISRFIIYECKNLEEGLNAKEDILDIIVI